MFDGLGSERTALNSGQTVTGTLTQDGFGDAVASTGSSSNPYKFAATSGYRDDGDCGLTHVGARYYDAQVGRFVTRDTYLSQKPYLYCVHDPVNYRDRTGHRISQSDIATIGVGLGAGAGGVALILAVLALEAAPVILVGAVIIGGGAIVLVGAYIIGDLIADKLYGDHNEELPSPTPGDLVHPYRPH